MRLFEDLSNEGKTIIMVTHDNSLASRTKRKLVIADGELIPEVISSAFPLLDHSQLMDLSHAAKQVDISFNLSLNLLSPEPAVLLISEGEFVIQPSGKTDPETISTGQIVSLPLPENTKCIPTGSHPVKGLLYPRNLFYQATGLSPEANDSKPSPVDSFLRFLKIGGKN
jgi:energy-coupling factor transporter ATP-binding protein EcfA2